MSLPQVNSRKDGLTIESPITYAARVHLGEDLILAASGSYVVIEPWTVVLRDEWEAFDTVNEDSFTIEYGGLRSVYCSLMWDSIAADYRMEFRIMKVGDSTPICEVSYPAVNGSPPQVLLDGHSTHAVFNFTDGDEIQVEARHTHVSDVTLLANSSFGFSSLIGDPDV